MVRNDKAPVAAMPDPKATIANVRMRPLKGGPALAGKGKLTKAKVISLNKGALTKKPEKPKAARATAQKNKSRKKA